MRHATFCPFHLASGWLPASSLPLSCLWRCGTVVAGPGGLALLCCWEPLALFAWHSRQADLVTSHELQTLSVDLLLQCCVSIIHISNEGCHTQVMSCDVFTNTNCNYAVSLKSAKWAWLPHVLPVSTASPVLCDRWHAMTAIKTLPSATVPCVHVHTIFVFIKVSGSSQTSFTLLFLLHLISGLQHPLGRLRPAAVQYA